MKGKSAIEQRIAAARRRQKRTKIGVKGRRRARAIEQRIPAAHVTVLGRDPFATHDKYGIRPQWVYRKHDRETQKILGLGPTAIEEAIKNGSLPPPAPLTEHGKAKGWWGHQLIAHMERRIAAAQRQAALPQQITQRENKEG